MRAPGFWSRPPGWEARALAPLAALYARAVAARLAQPGYRAGVPVICVGNVNVGGTGKTPAVIALVERLLALGARPHVISRGYGGRLRGPVRVEPQRHGADEVGDEPLLLSAFAPVTVARDRHLGARAAEDAGADVLVLDDGLQNPSLAKDLALLVVDAEAGFGNGRVLPAGPLREPMAAALARSDLLLTVGPEAAQQAFRLPEAVATAPTRIRGRLEPLPTGMDWTDLRVLAFAGIGRPKKFFRTLESLGAQVVGRVSLDDHQPLSVALLTRLAREASSAAAQLVTTEKDAVRLPPAFRGSVLILPVRLVLADPEALDARLAALLSSG